jgi:hypothetical protein
MSVVLDARTTRQPGHEISQRIRKRGEEIFGWESFGVAVVLHTLRDKCWALTMD